MPPIIVNKPVSMYKINIIVPNWNTDDIIKILHEFGALHVEKAGEGLKEYVKIYNKVSSIISMINSIMEYAKGRVLDVSLTLLEFNELSLEKIESDVKKIHNEIQVLNSIISDFENKLKEISSILNILSFFEPNTPISHIYYIGKYLSVATIYGSLDQIKSFLQLYKEKNITIFVLYKNQTEDIAIYSVVCQLPYEDFRRVAESYGLQILNLKRYISDEKTVGELINKLLSIKEDLIAKINNAKMKMDKIIEENLEYLSKYLLYLENMYARLTAVMSTYNTKYLSLISGWIPSKNIDKLEEFLKAEKVPYYLELKKPIKGIDEPPTLLENPPIIRWFEPIVKFIGIPRYWEWDPTPIIAYSFSLFYGIMLGDMGYAIAIILAALLILDKFVDDPSSRDYVFFKRSLILSSAIGFIIGALSGSFFGAQLYIITSVFTDPLSFLVLAILIGLIHVNISHALTLAKSIKEHLIGEALSEIGLFVAEIFGIPYIMYSMLHTPIPWIPVEAYRYLLIGALLGVLLIIIGMIKSMGGLGLLMWLFNLTGLLGDVLSYSRLAGVGLATVYLGASFNAIALLAYNGLKSMVPIDVAGIVLGGIVAGFILFFGHILNTALSALGGFIHSLRLCFVEFLSKFYEGSGYPYEPLRIVTRKRIIIG